MQEEEVQPIVGDKEEKEAGEVNFNMVVDSIEFIEVENPYPMGGVMPGTGDTIEEPPQSDDIELLPPPPIGLYMRADTTVWDVDTPIDSEAEQLRKQQLQKLAEALHKEAKEKAVEAERKRQEDEKKRQEEEEKKRLEEAEAQRVFRIQQAATRQRQGHAVILPIAQEESDEE